MLELEPLTANHSLRAEDHSSSLACVYTLCTPRAPAVLPLEESNNSICDAHRAMAHAQRNIGREYKPRES